MKKKLLLAATAMPLVLPACVMAQDTQTASLDGLEEIVVFGRDQTRQVQTLSNADILAAAPGTSPLQVIQKLPSVSFQSADPFGAYEWAVRISVRGFNQNQLGFTLDGVPLGDMSYGAHNGLHISRAVISENIGVTELAQGSGALETASTSNLGGTLKFLTRDPSDEMGGLIQATGGASNTLRPFLRFDTGSLGDNGPRAFISYVYSRADKWKGDGKQDYHHLNGKIVQPVGDGDITVYASWSDRKENDYQDMSLEMLDRLGYDWDNFFPNYDLALAVARLGQAGRPFSPPIMTLDDAYFDAAGLRRDALGYIRYEGNLTDALNVSAQIYGHHNKGQGSWITPYLPSPNGLPLSFRTTEYGIDRIGLIAGATYAVDTHEINGGVWVENNQYKIARRFYQMGVTTPDNSARAYQSNPFATQFLYRFITDTTQFHLQDTWNVIAPVNVNFGFKSLTVENKGKPLVGTIGGTIEAKDDFLPQVGMTADIATGRQVFLSYAENMRAFVASGVGASPFATTQAGFDAIKGSLKPEKSTTFEGGLRFEGQGVQGVVAAYHVKFKNRLLAVSQGPGIVGAPVALANVGGVTSKGIEVGTNFRLHDYVSLFGSFSYNDAKYDDDTVDGAGNRVATAGRRVVDAPTNLFKTELAYDDGAFFARAGLSYTNSRFYTYLNDSPVSGYKLVDLTFGYRLDELMPQLAGAEIQVNVNNLTDEKYVSTLGSNGFVNSDPAGTTQTLQVGAPRQIFLTVRAEF